MTKKLRIGSDIYIAPGILGKLDKYYNPIVRDERTNRSFDPTNVDHKILIYERQVKDWFLTPATRYVKGFNNGLIVLMICLSYLEGVEQYKKGRHSRGRSKQFFIDAAERLYSKKYSRHDLGQLYSEARCGLFHNGMVSGKIIFSYNFNDSLEFPDPSTIKVNPKKMLVDIKNDFRAYIHDLRTNQQSRRLFDRMYSNI